MKYKCIVSDLDWTLLKGDSELDRKTRDALMTLTKHGVMFVPATGRAFQSVPQCVLDIPGVKYVITSNGVAIYDTLSKTPIVNSHLQVKTVEKILKIAQEEDFVPEAFIQGKPYTGKEYYMDPVKFGARKESISYIQRTRTVVTDIFAFIEANKEQLDCIDIITKSDTKYEKIALLRELLPDNYITTSAPQLIEISTKDSGKHRRMQELMRMLHIDLSEVVAFGDGDNDSDMLALAGVGVAMANATETCRQSANFVTDTNENDGVYKALCKLFPEYLCA